MADPGGEPQTPGHTTLSIREPSNPDGPVNFNVDPNKHYVIGVRPAGACTAYHGGVSGKSYLPSGGYHYLREYESNSSTLSTSWVFSGLTYGYAQQLVFE